MAQREAADGRDERARRAAHEQQQAEHEEQVIGAEQDVLDAERQIGAQDLARALALRHHEGSGARARGITDHEADGYVYFPLKDIEKYLRPNDENVIAIEGHNNSRTSTDFTLDPYLIAVPKEGAK